VCVCVCVCVCVVADVPSVEQNLVYFTSIFGIWRLTQTVPPVTSHTG